jgi:transportin-1
MLQQVINVYRQIIPQFDQFIQTMPPSDQVELKKAYAI